MLGGGSLLDFWYVYSALNKKKMTQQTGSDNVKRKKKSVKMICKQEKGSKPDLTGYKNRPKSYKIGHFG